MGEKEILESRSVRGRFLRIAPGDLVLEYCYSYWYLIGCGDVENESVLNLVFAGGVISVFLMSVADGRI